MVSTVKKQPKNRKSFTHLTNNFAKYSALLVDTTKVPGEDKVHSKVLKEREAKGK